MSLFRKASPAEGNKTRQQKLGKQAEQLALQFLETQGMHHLCSNYHCRYGELDLIMLHQQTVIFVEVRHRLSSHWGSALDSITSHKQQRLLKAAQVYLARNKQYQSMPCRFDVISMDGALSEQNINWITDAIQAH